MTRSELRQSAISLCLCLITAATTLFIVQRSNKKIAVVDGIKLFNAYKMKLELEARDRVRLEKLRHDADSLQQDFTTKSKAAGIPHEELQQSFLRAREANGAFEQEYQHSNQEINQQVWARLNSLIESYGKEQSLRLIIGANGMGNVLYSDNYYDHTKALTDYVNKKYEAGN